MSHIDPPKALGALGFLVGRFHGEGEFQRGGVTVAKEVFGRWEVGGHFLSLSMTASYRLRDAVADVHHAMAVVGAGRSLGELHAHVFTDVGEVLEHRLVIEPDRVTFRDRVPHEARARGARKTLVRTSYGYEEMLEVERDEDRFERYSVVRLHRLPESP
jgi:hypothetical protein